MTNSSRRETAVFVPPLRTRGAFATRASVRSSECFAVDPSAYFAALREDVHGLSMCVVAYVDEHGEALVQTLLEALDSPHDTVWILASKPFPAPADPRGFVLDRSNPLHRHQESLLTADVLVIGSEMPDAMLTRWQDSAGALIIDIRLDGANVIAAWATAVNIPLRGYLGGAKFLTVPKAASVIDGLVAGLTPMIHKDQRMELEFAATGLAEVNIGCLYKRTSQVLTATANHNWPTWAVAALGLWFAPSEDSSEGVIVSRTMRECMPTSWLTVVETYVNGAHCRARIVPTYTDAVMSLGDNLYRSLTSKPIWYRGTRVIANICEAAIASVISKMPRFASDLQPIRKMMSRRSLTA